MVINVDVGEKKKKIHTLSNYGLYNSKETGTLCKYILKYLTKNCQKKKFFFLGGRPLLIINKDNNLFEVHIYYLHNGKKNFFSLYIYIFLITKK